MTVRARAILLLLLVPVSAMLLVLMTPPVEDFSLDSERWTGLAQASNVLQVGEVWNVEMLEDQPAGSTLFVIPRKSFSERDMAGIGAFVERGGALVVMDDFGYANQLLEALGLDVSVAGGGLVDPVNCIRNEMMPIAAAEPPGSGDERMVLALNHASWLVVGQDVDLWAMSSRFSFGDVNGNGLRDREEPAGPLPVAASCPLGDGTVHIVADCSIAINAMVDEANNAAILTALAGERVMMDMSRLPDSGADAGKRFVSQARRTSGTVLGLTFLLLGMSFLALLYPWYNRGRRYGQ